MAIAKVPKEILELPLDVRAEMALMDAYETAMEEHIRWNLPMHFWKDGKVIEVPVEELRKELAERKAQREKSEATE